MARAGPRTSGQMMAPPSPATMPTFTCGSRERGRFRHEDDVAEEHDRRAEADRGAGHGRDHGNLDVEQIVDDLFRVVPQRFEALGRAQRRKPREVAAGAEGAAARREHHRARAAAVAKVAEEPRELAVEEIVDRVEVARRVLDRDHEHVAVADPASALRSRGGRAGGLSLTMCSCRSRGRGSSDRRARRSPAPPSSAGS